MHGFLCHRIADALQVGQTVKQNIGLPSGAAKSGQRTPVRHGTADRDKLKAFDGRVEL